MEGNHGGGEVKWWWLGPPPKEDDYEKPAGKWQEIAIDFAKE